MFSWKAFRGYASSPGCNSETEYDCGCGELMIAAADEGERLQAIVNTFEKTADGVTPTIGMELYHPNSDGTIQWFKVYTICKNYVQALNVWNTTYVTANCYSTKAAAEAAKGNP